MGCSCSRTPVPTAGATSRNMSTPSGSRTGSCGGRPPTRGRTSTSISGRTTSSGPELGPRKSREVAEMSAERHAAPETGPALRVKALEAVLREKGLVDPSAIDLLVETYETKIGPKNGARVV